MGERIAVVGATGYTGGLVVAELVERGVEVVAAGCDRSRLDALPAEVERQVVDVTDRLALAAALDGCRAAVNCVGSFQDFGEPVVGAAIAAAIPYVDTAGEFPFLRRVFELHDEPARRAGVAVVPGMAFYSAPADLIAALAVESLGRPPETVEIAYRLVGARPSRGTLRTNLRRIGQPCPVWEDGRLGERSIGDEPRTFRFPEPYGPVAAARWPGAEVLTVPRHSGARSVAVYLGMPKVAAAAFRSPAVARALQTVGRAVVGERTGGPSAEARHRAGFAIVVRVRAGGDETRGVIEGRDFYGVTVAVCAEAAQRLSAPAVSRAGVLAPAEAFDPADVLDSLARYLIWRIER